MRNRKVYTIMDAKAVDGVGNYIDVRDFRNVVITIASEDSSELVVKCVGAIGDTSPDFTAAQSPTNQWDYIEMADLTDSSAPVRGATGITLTGTDVCNIYEINVNGLDWLNFIISSYAVGKLTITLTEVDNA